MAVPETLEFAAFLRSNASARAKELQYPGSAFVTFRKCIAMRDS